MRRISVLLLLPDLSACRRQRQIGIAAGHVSTTVATMELSAPSVRCFIGIRPVGTTVTELAALRDHLERAGGNAVRWHPPQKWHVTLCFLGDQDAALLPVFKTAMADACAQAAQFTLTAAGLNLWPTPRRAKVISLKVAGDVAALAALQHNLAGRLAAFLPASGKPFTPHLTLGYVRRGGVIGAELRERLQQLASAPLTGWPVRTVELMRGGETHSTLASTPLPPRRASS